MGERGLFLNIPRDLEQRRYVEQLHIVDAGQLDAVPEPVLDHGVL